MNINDMVEVFHVKNTLENFATALFVTVTSNFPSLDLSNIDAAPMHCDIITLKKIFSNIEWIRQSKYLTLNVSNRL